MQASACASHHAPYFLFTVFDGSSATGRRLAACRRAGVRDVGDASDAPNSSSSCAITALTESSSSLTLKRMQPLRTMITGASKRSESAGSTRREYRVAGCHGCQAQFVFVTWV